MIEEVSNNTGITWDRDYQDTESSLYTNCAKSWIQDCLENHECSSVHSRHNLSAPANLRPKRLLFVGDSQYGPRLVDEPLNTPYAALSHCWGPDGLPETGKTLTKNLATRKQSVSLTLLPQNFQDAVKITRGLDIQFLWIDALCIIQDDKNDWVEEGSKMG